MASNLTEEEENYGLLWQRGQFFGAEAFDNALIVAVAVVLPYDWKQRQKAKG